LMGRELAKLPKDNHQICSSIPALAAEYLLASCVAIMLR
jgi:hypothetical protein